MWFELRRKEKSGHSVGLKLFLFVSCVQHEEWVVMPASWGVYQVQGNKSVAGYPRNISIPPSLPFFHKYFLSLSKHSYKPYSKGDRHLKDNKLITIVINNEGEFRVL